jgi:hypothetical protein
VLRPATEYVAKFTRDVPREKVLCCADLMEPLGSAPVSSPKVHKDAIIATVAEAVLTEKESVQVVDDAGTPVGILNCKTILHILFGARGIADLVREGGVKHARAIPPLWSDAGRPLDHVVFGPVFRHSCARGQLPMAVAASDCRMAGTDKQCRRECHV